ncbi:unnamed protein product [Peniophora sp. CBMAI 1063]|nr:unnamed protein product [Peniophora sp. CBMAI 1063]
MSPPSYDDIPPPYVLGDVVPSYTKHLAGSDNTPDCTSSPSYGLAYTSLKANKSGFTSTTSATVTSSPPAAAADGEAIVNVAPDRAPTSRTVLMTHTETYTDRVGEHSHAVAWLWLENGRVYYGRHAAPGLYNEAGPSPLTMLVACVDGQVLPHMKQSYHRASPEVLGVSLSRLAGRDTGPALCSHNPSSSPSSVKLDEHEIEMYERLWGHPHPNVTQYHGVSAVDDEYITGIQVSASKLTLQDALLDWPFMRLGSIERGLYAGIAHLHSHGICHNNLNLSSVRMSDAGGAILADLRFATVINTDGSIDVPSVGGGLKGWLLRRHDPDYTAARHLMREARTLRLYAAGRFVYWKAWGVVRAVLSGLKGFAINIRRLGRTVRDPLLLVLDRGF